MCVQEAGDEQFLIMEMLPGFSLAHHLRCGTSFSERDAGVMLSKIGASAFPQEFRFLIDGDSVNSHIY